MTLFGQKQRRYTPVQEDISRDFPVAEHAKDMVALLSLAGIIKYVNLSLVTASGYAKKELLGQNFRDFIHPDDSGKLVSWQNFITERGRVRTKKGSWLWIEANSSRLAWKGVAYICVILRDITARMEIEAALKESEEKLNNLIKYAPTAIYEIDFRKIRFTSVNDSMCRLSGYSREELLSMNPFDLLDGDSKSIFQDRINKTLKGLKIDPEVAYAVITKDGRKLDVVLQVSLTCQNGQPTGAFVIGHDVTEAKRLERDLRESEERFRIITQTIPVGVGVVSLEDRKFLFVNDVYAESVGYRVDELLGREVPLVYWDLAEREKIVRMLKEYSYTADYEVRLKRKDGSLLWALASTRRISFNGTPALLGVFIDISERKKTEAMLEEAKRILDTLMEYVPEGITLVDASDRKITMVSRYGLDILGGSHSGMTTPQVIKQWKVFQSDGKTEMRHEDLPSSRALAGETVRNLEVIQLNRFGKRLVLSCNAAPVMVKGDITGAVIAWRDITKLKKIEDALKASERHYRLLFRQMTEGFALHEVVLNRMGKVVDYRFLEVNPAFEKLTGLRCRDIIGKLKTEVLPGDDPKWIEIYGQVALSGKPADFENYSPVLKRHYRVYAFSPSPGKFATLFSDITKRVEMEKRKDDFINIASHELKTPLTSIKAYGQILKEYIGKNKFGKLGQITDRMNSQITTLQGYVNDLLDVSKIQAGKLLLRKEEFDIWDLQKRVCGDCSEMVGDHEIVSQSVHQNIIADMDRIGQVLVNLITNAAKYSLPGSKIEIRSGITGSSVTVSVRDFGIGISRAHQKNLFKRFYQVEDLDRRVYGGLGLGLFISKEIMDRHGGSIGVESEEGKGSTFSISIPIT